MEKDGDVAMEIEDESGSQVGAAPASTPGLNIGFPHAEKAGTEMEVEDECPDVLDTACVSISAVDDSAQHQEKAARDEEKDEEMEIDEELTGGVVSCIA